MAESPFREHRNLKHPCRSENGDCPRRKCGCSADCPEWAAWVRFREADREAKRKFNEIGRYQAATAAKVKARSAAYKKMLDQKK